MQNTSVAKVLVLLTLAAGLTGCEQGGPEGALEGETIEVIAIWKGGEQDPFPKVLELFERQTGADVHYVSGGYELSTLVQTRVQGGNPPNVAISPHAGVVAELARNGALKPLDQAVVDLVERNYSPIWKRLGSVDGKLYSVYYTASNKSTFWYNDQLLSENGFEPPQSWIEFLELCTSLSNRGISPVALAGATGWVLTDWFENVYLQTAGPQMYDKLSRHEIPWTDPSVRRALETLRQFFAQDVFIDGGRTGALQTDYEDSVFNVFGPQPRAAMVYEGTFVADVINDSTEAVVGDDAKIFPFPTINPHSVGTVVGGDAAVALKDDRATMEFMRFMASPEAAAEWARRGGFLSPNRLLSLDTYPDDQTRTMARTIVEAGDEVRFDLSDLYPAQFGAAEGAGVRKAMQDFLGNPDDIDGVMQQMEAAATAALQ